MADLDDVKEAVDNIHGDMMNLVNLEMDTNEMLRELLAVAKEVSRGIKNLR